MMNDIGITSTSTAQYTYSIAAATMASFYCRYFISRFIAEKIRYVARTLMTGVTGVIFDFSRGKLAEDRRGYFASGESATFAGVSSSV